MARSRLPAWLLALLLVLVTIALFWPATSHDFVNYDDDMYVKDNTHVASGLTLEMPGGRFAVTTPATGTRSPGCPTCWTANVRFESVGPSFYQRAAARAQRRLVFVWLRLMTGATWRSLLVAALFALHPLRVESVAWVSERKDVLSGFFVCSR